MPVNRVWNLEALAAALSAFPLQSGERITLEYVLLKGVTDSLEDGRRLAAFARRFPAKVNLIPFNPHEGSGFEPPDEARVERPLPPAVRRRSARQRPPQPGPGRGRRLRPAGAGGASKQAPNPKTGD